MGNYTCIEGKYNKHIDDLINQYSTDPNISSDADLIEQNVKQQIPNILFDK